MYKTCILVMALMGLPFVTGCAGDRNLATIGGWNYRSIHAPHLLTPNATILVKVNVKTGEVQELKIFGGKALGPVIAKGALGVAASEVYGHSIEPDSDNVNLNNGSTSGSANTNTNTNNNTGGGGPPFGNGPPNN